MKKTILLLVSIFTFCQVQSQTLAPLTVEKIMRDPAQWIGNSPNNPFWSEDSKTVYFYWNPTKAKGDSLYKVTGTDRTPVKVSPQERRSLPSRSGDYSRDFSKKLFTNAGYLYVLDCKTNQSRRLMPAEGNASFSGDTQKVVYSRNSNLYSYDLNTGEIITLSNFIVGSKKSEIKAGEQEKWLKNDQLAMFDILKERKAKRDEAEKIAKADKPKTPKEIYTDEKVVMNQQLSPSGRYLTYYLMTAAKGSKTTIVPSYVTESGFTEDIAARTKVGAAQNTIETFIYDTQRDSVYQVITKDITGIADEPDYIKDYAKKDSTKRKPTPRKVAVLGPYWSDDGQNAVCVVRSYDNKDRWIMTLNPATGKLKLLDRQRDEAWIAGPGIGFSLGGGTLGWIDSQTFYYQSEADGYSHLYTVNVTTGVKKQLTQGRFEVQSVVLSKNKQFFYITTNEVHPGEQHLYKMSVNGGERLQLTSATGGHDVTLSPDETKIIDRYSYMNKPWELFLQETTPNAKVEVLTNSTSDEFKSYPWRAPEIITFKASDGTTIYARLYTPTKKNKNKKAVIFVHGAGYLQNAHRWWSQYSREYMFHNLLTDRGYTVLDIDYRASAGYGRDVRTGIYRFMGGKDLSDNTDGAKYLIEKQGIDPARIGIYGGSYGGFMTLMALFTTPDVFKAGAALRPVTDWAAYNHPYTANILNEPQTDSLAYRKSSPIYHAAGLKNHLLICHGMVDVNVHYQDAVRLAQRLIELQKNNWEMASYPMEDHGFVEATSWMDEYKRILKLFEEKL
jgi:dipeptidyl aminopeptidase/acylaminoacyl peptidase